MSLEDVEQPVWQSLDEGVAVASQTGKVTGLSKGMALITATGGEEAHVIYVKVTSHRYNLTDADH